MSSTTDMNVADAGVEMTMNMVEKLMTDIENGKDEYEKTMTGILDSLWRGKTDEKGNRYAIDYDKETGELEREEGKPFPMEDVINYIYNRLNGISEIEDMVEDGDLMDSDDWEANLDIDLDDARDVFERWENDELLDRDKVDEIAEERAYELKEEIEELKEANETLKGNVSVEAKELMFAVRISELEIKELKEEIKGLTQSIHNGLEAQMKDEEEINKLKEENEELKSLTQNKINEAVISEPLVGKLYVDIAKLMEVVESKDKTIKWWKDTLLDLLGKDSEEGAKWNAPYEFDVKARDIIEELGDRLGENKTLKEEIEELKENIADMEKTTELMEENIKKGGKIYGLMKEETSKEEKKEEILNNLHSQLANPFHPVGLEKADMENDTKHFQKVIDDGHLKEALFHMKMTEPVFGEYKNFRKFINEMNKPTTTATAELPYPPPMMKKGKWATCETEEDEEKIIKDEEKITKEYIDGYGIPTLPSIKHFINNYKGDNEAVSMIKKWINSDRDYMIYDGLVDILKNCNDKEKVKAVGEDLVSGCNHIGASHMEAMRCVHYLLCWFMKSSNNMCIGSYPRLVEFYWGGIGEWLA
jgi:hypothetical protein